MSFKKVFFTSHHYWKDLLIIFFIAASFFPFRHVINFQNASRFGWYIEPLAISIYAADFIFISIILFFGKNLLEAFKRNWLLLSAIIVFFLAQSARNSDPALGGYMFLRFFQFAVLLLLFSITLRSKKNIKLLCIFLLIIGSLQSTLVLYQVTNSHSLGLKWFGEQTIDIGKAGVAKVDLAHGKLIRGYGTLPHPNILAGLLTITIAANLWLIRTKTTKPTTTGWFESQSLRAKRSNLQTFSWLGIALLSNPEPAEGSTRDYRALRKDDVFSYIQTNIGLWILYCLVLLQIIGMTLTFSRAGFVSLTILFILFFYSQAKKGIINLKKWGTFILFMLILLWLINSFTRGAIYQRLIPPKTDISLTERIFLFRESGEVLKQNFLLGLGNGQYIINYIISVPPGTGIEKWQYDFPHNVVVQSCSELGFLGFLIFALLVFTLIKYNTKNWRYFWFSIAIIFPYLMFDHFLLTNQSGRILLVLSLTLLPKILESGSVEFGNKKGY